MRSGVRVIVIDEDWDVLHLVERWLAPAGYEVLLADNPLAAHDAWIAKPCEVIVVDADVGGPGAGVRLAKGLGLLRPELAVMVISGSAPAGGAARGLRSTGEATASSGRPGSEEC